MVVYRKSRTDELAEWFSQEIACLIAQGPEFDPQDSQKMLGLAVQLYRSAGETETGGSPGLAHVIWSSPISELQAHEKACLKGSIPKDT